MAGTLTSGTFVAAVLESVGYHYQSHILDALKEPFQGGLGGLVYLVGVIVAIVHTAIQGRYNFGAWLLIGPPLFFSVVLTREPVNNARWEFGKDARPQAGVDHQTEQLLASQGEEAGGQARVSFLFAAYARLISGTSQEIVRIINDGRKKTDLWFVMKAELFARSQAGSVDTPALNRLIFHGLGSQCSGVWDRAYQISDPLRPQVGNAGAGPLTAAQRQARDEFDRMIREPNVRLDPLARRYIALRRLGAGNHSEDTIQQEALKPEVNRNYSCLEVWDLVREGLIEQAQRQLNNLEQDAVINGITSDALIDLLNQAHGGEGGQLGIGQRPQGVSQAAQRIVRIMAKYILRNTLQNSGRGAFIENLAEKQEMFDTQIESESRDSATERARLGSREWAEKARLAAALTNVPYYQGLALYFLGLTFPFFALLLLIPGKHAGFLLWFMLWMWVKSWDIALAMVMLIDDMLFSMLAVGRQRGRAEPEIPVAFEAVVRSLREIDPSFQLATYYSLIAVAVLSIPVITAQLLFGSLKGGAGIISQGVQRFSSTFADSSMIRHSQLGITNSRFRAQDNRMNWTREYLENQRTGGIREGQRLRNDAEVAGLRAGVRTQAGRESAGAGDVARSFAIEALPIRGGRSQNMAYSAGIARGFATPTSGMGLAFDAANLNTTTRGYITPAGGRGTNVIPLGGGRSSWQPTRVDRSFMVGARAADGIAQMGYLYSGIDSQSFSRELNLGHTWGAWDAAHSGVEREFLFLGTVYGQLQVPWMNFASPGYEAEYDKSVMEFEQRVKQASTSIRATFGLGDDSPNLIQNYIGGSGTEEERNRPFTTGRAVSSNSFSAVALAVALNMEFRGPNDRRHEEDSRDYMEYFLRSYQSMTGRDVDYLPSGR